MVSRQLGSSGRVRSVTSPTAQEDHSGEPDVAERSTAGAGSQLPKRRWRLRVEAQDQTPPRPSALKAPKGAPLVLALLSASARHQCVSGRS